MNNRLLASNLPQAVHIANVEPRSVKDDSLFAELTSVLSKHHALDRFGITLLHRHFDMTAGEVLLETTDVESRIQTIRPIRQEELGGHPYIETSWRLDDKGIAMACSCISDGRDHSHQSRG